MSSYREVIIENFWQGCVKHYNPYSGQVYYLKDNKLHHETTSAINTIDSLDAQYYLDGELFGNQNDFTDETWTKFVVSLRNK